MSVDCHTADHLDEDLEDSDAGLEANEGFVLFVPAILKAVGVLLVANELILPFEAVVLFVQDMVVHAVNEEQEARKIHAQRVHAGSGAGRAELGDEGREESESVHAVHEDEVAVSALLESLALLGLQVAEQVHHSEEVDIVRACAEQPDACNDLLGQVLNQHEDQNDDVCGQEGTNDGAAALLFVPLHAGDSEEARHDKYLNNDDRQSKKLTQKSYFMYSAQLLSTSVWLSSSS